MFADTLPSQPFPAIEDAPLVLPAELTIYVVDELMTQWLPLLEATDAPPELTVDAARVEQVDAAGVQLLVALGVGLARRHRQLRLRSPSAPLADACRRLGLADWLAGATHGGPGR
jgi:anti-anti-sigma regulatory factor